MEIAYLDCFSGISGDMFLGALLDLGLPLKELEEALKTLPLSGYAVETKREARNQIFGTRFSVSVPGDDLHHRNFSDIRRIVQQGDFSERVQEKALTVFEELAKAEAAIHGIPLEEIHFHEVGAVDSIIDIVGTVFGIERLGISEVHVSPLPLGSGFVETRHGRLPVPAPATVALLRDVPVYPSGLPFEMVTPTGAALVKGLAKSFGSMPTMTLRRVGYGVGKRELPDRPNLARILIGSESAGRDPETVVVLETNLDDSNPEWLSYIMDKLFQAGALDVVFCPVYMKKNRPGVQIQVLGRPHQKKNLMEILFRESTTLGVRFRYSQREVRERSFSEVESPWGKMRVKQFVGADGLPFFLPEYEACREAAIKGNRPLKEIYRWVMALNEGKSE
jgi:uncharacterized protein (TIGR00299 family) protein